MRLIDADALIEKLKKLKDDIKTVSPSANDKICLVNVVQLIDFIDNAPTIEPSEYLKTIPTVYLLEALGVGSVDELMEEAEVMDEIEAYRSLIPDHKQNAEPSGDLISRADAIKELEEYIRKKRTMEDAFEDKSVWFVDGLELSIALIEELPSVSAEIKEYVKDGTLTVQARTIKEATLIDKVVVYADGYEQEYLMPIPSAERVGEWELCEDIDGEYGVCSVCGTDADFSHYGIPYNYCPSCGAKMGE